MHAVRRVLEGLDRGVYQAERALLFVSLVMMTVLVFGEVVVRTFTRPVGKTAALLLWVAERFGEVPEPARKQIVELWGPLFFSLLSLGLCVFAAHSARQMRAQRQGGDAARLPTSIVVGALVFLALAGAVKLFIWRFPTGIAGAQKFALGFMVWAGFLGASLATRARRHIVLDAVKKKLDPVVLPWFSFLGALATAAFTATLGYLASHKLATQIEEWSASGGRIHVFEALPIPEWLVTLALPVSLFLIAARFFCQGLSDLLYGPSLETGADAHGVDLEALKEEAAAKEGTAPPEPGGPLYGRPHVGMKGRPLPRRGAS